MENVITAARAEHGCLFFEAVLFHYVYGLIFQLFRQKGLDHDGFVGGVNPAGKQQAQPRQELNNPVHQLRFPSSGIPRSGLVSPKPVLGKSIGQIPASLS